LKKGLLMIGTVVLMFALGWAATYRDIRVAGSSGNYFDIDVDTTGSGAATIFFCDTFFSDTFDIDSTYRYLNYAVKLRSFDSGSVLDGDTVMDTITVGLITYFNGGGSKWLVALDTFTNVGDSVRHHIICDTMIYNKAYFRTIYSDSIAATAWDTNRYNWQFDVLLGGTR